MYGDRFKKEKGLCTMSGAKGLLQMAALSSIRRFLIGTTRGFYKAFLFGSVACCQLILAFHADPIAEATITEPIICL